MTHRERESIDYITLKVVLGYTLAGVVWIWGSDRLLSALAERAMVDYMQTLKGWLFVLVSAAALYALLQRYLSRLHAVHQAARRNVEKFSALFHGANDSIALVGFNQDGTLGRFAEVNDAISKRLGYSREELLAMSLLDVVQPGSVNVAEILRRLEQEGTATFETVHLARDGSVTPVEINARLVNIGGKKMLLSIARDIGERKAAEAKIQGQLDELLRFQKATVGRELHMKELLEELAVLKARLAERVSKHP